MRMLCLLTLAFAAIPLAHAVQLATDGVANADIILAADAQISDQTAATELATYLGKITGGEFTVVNEPGQSGKAVAVYVGPTAFARNLGIDPAALAEEEWIIRTADNALVLVGGGHRGTLYAVYRFLEEVLGVRWWSPWEESVPDSPSIDTGDLDLTGKPVLRYRDIYMLYGRDGGACAARNRLNREGDARITKEYGGCMDYGPPYHVHTFYMYFPPDPYFKQHPEWFSLIGGERQARQHQLCLTNPELRAAFLEKLRNFIATSEREAEAKQVPPPVVYSVSQNDWGGQCQCEACQAVAKAEESEAGLLLDFCNYLADGIKDEYPYVYLDTLAYMYTQKPPKNVKARDNVIIRLCDTDSNATQPITTPQNKEFHDFLLSWANIAKNLRVWDYAVTYAAPQGLPYPSVHTFAPDYRFYAEHNVEGVFTEHEYEVTSDLHDLKAWMMMKLQEDPYRDDKALLETFTDGFYGPAGPMIRQYLAELQAACDQRGSYIAMSPGPSGFSFLTFDFVSAAHRIFDSAEAAVGDDEVLLRRVRHARMHLDRGTVVLYKDLMRQWIGKGNAPETMPIDRDAVAERYRETWYTQADMRCAEAAAAASKRQCDAEIARYSATPAFVALPEKFAGLPAGTVFDFTADYSRNWNDIVKVVKDPEAESGITNRLDFPNSEPVDHALEKYKLPMPWGLYQQATGKFSYSQSIRAEAVPGPGYHWYKMGQPQKIGPSYYLYFFWSWIIQVDIDSVVDPANPDQEFEIWARIKFEGPFFPHGKAEDKNAICVERVVLVKHQG